MNFAFAKGDDVEIKLDSKVLGGVKKAVCTSKNAYYDIGSFLSDTPVYRESESSYTVELYMDCSLSSYFDDKARFNLLEFVCNEHTEQFCDCTVESMQTVINPIGVIEMIVTIKAEERNVI